MIPYTVIEMIPYNPPIFYSLQFRKNDTLNPNSDSTLTLILGNPPSQSITTRFEVSCDTLIFDHTLVDGDLVRYRRK